MSPADARVSSTVGEKYRITRFIAEGGMGAVYEAQHLFVRRRFAIKFLRRELAQRRDVIARFKDEAQAAGALEHENIAAVVDFGVAGDGTPYLVMEYLDGSDLGALLAATGPLPAERAADLVLQAALGAHAAHAAGVVHRDLKPQNLFVCRRNDGTDLLKLLDFGIAKLQASDAREAVTRTGTVLGTPAYMSPEQARGETGLDARTDVYSLGVILYELLSGELPHPGDSHNAVIHHIATESALPLASKSGAIPDELVELVVATLSREAGARPASAEELSERLRPFARRKAWAPSERPPSPELAPGHESTLPAPVAFSGAAARDEGQARPERAAKTTRRWVPVLGLVVLAGTVALANALLREPPATTVPAKMTKAGPEPAPSAAPMPSALPATTARAEQTPPASAPVASTRPREQESAVPRPVRLSQRPDGQLPATQLRAKSPPAASADETGARFDDHNPYR